MTRASNLLTISAAVAAIVALSACNKRDDQTVGQTVDKGVASAKAEMKDAKEATKDARPTLALLSRTPRSRPRSTPHWWQMTSSRH